MTPENWWTMEQLSASVMQNIIDRETAVPGHEPETFVA
jgi:hypothetical protein